MGLKEKMHHERWPSALFYTPVFLYYLYNSLKLRKLNYFAAVNPAMETGGLCGFSKSRIYTLIPKEYLPKTILLEKKYYSQSDLYTLLKENQLKFPLVIKPDKGERGFLVNKVNDIDKLHFQLKEKTKHIPFLIQEYIDVPLELGVFAIKQETGWVVTSLTSKKFWSVTGDGEKTIKELVLETEKNDFSNLNHIDLYYVPKKEEVVLLEPIGNHCRGTDFINECHRIDEKIQRVFNKILQQVEGVNYCRVDLRAKSWEAVKRADIKIMELNGVSAEPGHIYDTKIPLRIAYKDLFFHWKEMAKIAQRQLLHSEIKTENFFETATRVREHMMQKRRIQKKKAEPIEKLVGCENFDLEKHPEQILLSFKSADLLEQHRCYISESGYERTTLYEDENYELVFCHWKSKGGTLEHYHPNRKCWFRCLTGEITEYKVKSKVLQVLGVDQVGFIEDSLGPHKMWNDSTQDTYTLHLYQKTRVEY